MTGDCRDFEPWLSAWLDAELDDDRERRVGAHLHMCAACRAEVESLHATKAVLRSTPSRRMPAELALRLTDPAGAGVPTPPGRPGGSGPPGTSRLRSPALLSNARGRASQLVGTAAVLLGIAAGTAVALEWSASDAPVVRVPMEVFVADHVLHTAGSPVTTPVLADTRR
jgi:anti-sigma factor RsiW